LLATQLFLTSLFLIAIVVETRLAHVQILKGSTLATMCALNGTARGSVGGISDFKALNERARLLVSSLSVGVRGQVSGWHRGVGSIELLREIRSIERGIGTAGCAFHPACA
jgi:hypothetical protein